MVRVRRRLKFGRKPPKPRCSVDSTNTDGFVEFYENGPERLNESPWPSLKQICGYAAGAIGVLTLGAILTQET